MLKIDYGAFVLGCFFLGSEHWHKITRHFRLIAFLKFSVWKVSFDLTFCQHTHEPFAEKQPLQGKPVPFTSKSPLLAVFLNPRMCSSHAYTQGSFNRWIYPYKFPMHNASPHSYIHWLACSKCQRCFSGRTWACDGGKTNVSFTED